MKGNVEEVREKERMEEGGNGERKGDRGRRIRERKTEDGGERRTEKRKRGRRKGRIRSKENRGRERW